MKKLLTGFLFILFSVSTVKTCNGVEEIILQPYLGRKVTYPDDYPVKTGYEASKNCSWKISAPKGYFIVSYPKWVCDADVNIGLYYGATTSAQIDRCVSCPKTNGYCSDIIQTRSSEALLSMLTVSPHSAGGFQFRFMAVERNTTSACVSSGTRLLAAKTPNFIMSPNFPSNYESNLNCLWSVEPAVNERDTHLIFEFRSQYLEMGFDSCTDFVKINNLNDFCEQGEDTILQSSSPIQLTGVTANVRFTSDFGYSGSGFVLAFYIEKKATPCSCQHGGTCINSTCLCSRGYKGSSCENESLEILYFRSSKTVFREENDVLFESEITDNSIFTVQWSRDGVIISGILSRYTISSSAKSNGTFLHQLRISNVYEREEGNWSIMASNGVTMVNRSIIIRVLPKLVLQMIPQYDLSIETKENLILECVVVNPESLINLTDGSLIWVKDEKPILTDSGFNISTTNTSTILNKAIAEVNDSGIYSCLHSTYPDPLNVSIYVNITKPESVEILFFRISESLSREGKSVWLETDIIDISDLSVQWFHNGNLIDNSSLRYIITSYSTGNGTLRNVLSIPDVLRQDEGDWNITASNGKTTESMNVFLRVLPRLVLQMIPPNNISIESKESINLLCVVTNPESLFNLSGGGLFWQKDGKKISPDSGFNITTTDTSTTLNKLSAEEGDAGTYSCSHSAYPDPIDVSLYINITEPKSVEILSFRSSSSVLREGKSLRFESEIAFDPALIVQWFHDGKLINNSSKYTITSSITSNSTSVHVLKIFNVLLQDEGEWNITASNRKTTETKSIRIQVLEKLKLQITPQYDFSIQRGEGIVLECVVINPGSLQNLIGGSLIWQKDGQKIFSGFHINTTNTSTQLRKTSSEIDDSGSYSCSHSAYPDPINVSININVTEPEPIEILTLKINKPLLIEGETASFESEIVNKSGLIVQWFHNGNPITDALSRFSVTFSTKANNTLLYVLNISSMVLQDEGDWNITATNGLTTASRGIRVQVFPRISLRLTPEDDLSIQTGEVIQLQCEALYTETPAYSTGIKLNWKRDGNDISSDSSFSVIETGTTSTLNKSSAELTDSGQYSCSHSVYSNSGDVSVYINVTESDKDKPCPCQHGGTCMNSTCVCPSGYQGRFCEDEHIEILSYKSGNSVIREGKSVWFKAEIVGPVGFIVQWSRNGDLIGSTASRYVMTTSKTTNGTTLHVLTITDVLQRDDGYWTVKALTGLTAEAGNITVKVLPRLLLQMAPQYDFSIKTGESIYLRCGVINPKSLTGLSDGSLVWKKDGVNILLDSGFNINTTNLSSTLEKELADLGDAGRFSCFHSSYPDPVSVSIAISVTKPEQIRCADDEFDKIKWKSTIAGTIKKESCPENQKGTATRYCNFQGVWESPDLINCTDVALVNANEELDNIIADGTTKNVDEAVNNTLVKMKNLTSQRSELSAGDISSSLDILEKIVNVTNMTSANVQKEAFFAVVDNVLSTNNSKSWTAVSDKTEKDASSLLKNMDRMSEVVLKKENITTSKFKGKNFEVSVDKTKVDEKGIVFPEKTEKTPNDTSTDTEEYSTFLELPKQTNKIEKPITYVAVIYKTISDILPTDSGSQKEENSNEVTEGKEKKKKEFVNSEILSLTTQTNLGILSPPLNLAFQHKHENKSADLQAVCVSWDFTTNKWSEEGCKVNSTNIKRTVCQCNHLTNFAILMRPYTPETEDGASLKTLSLVGVIISIAFTVLTLMLFVLTWKQVKSDQNIMLLNLCGSLVVSYIVFIAAVEKTENEGVCIFITALIHYLFLVTFFCMLSMGIYYCMSITVTFYAMYVANNFKSKSRVQWFLLGSWGIPLIIAAITLGAFWGNGYHLKHYCWLSMESGSLFLFIVPVCVIAVMNILIMVSLIRVLCASSAMTKSSLQKKAASGLRSLGTLLPVLGVTWIFGVLAVNESAEIFQYIFIIANSLQGFCIFISHVLMNKKLMMGIKTKYPSLSGLSMFTESSKKETSSVSRSHSSRSETPLVKPKKKRSLPIIGSFLNKKSMKNNKVMKSNSFMTEKTVSTDCPCSETQENSLAMTENAPKEDESSKMIFKEVKTSL